MADVAMDMLGQMLPRMLDCQRWHDQDLHEVRVCLGSIERSMAELKRNVGEAVDA